MMKAMRGCSSLIEVKYDIYITSKGFICSFHYYHVSNSSFPIFIVCDKKSLFNNIQNNSYPCQPSFEIILKFLCSTLIYLKNLSFHLHLGRRQTFKQETNHKV